MIQSARSSVLSSQRRPSRPQDELRFHPVCSSERSRRPNRTQTPVFPAELPPGARLTQHQVPARQRRTTLESLGTLPDRYPKGTVTIPIRHLVWHQGDCCGSTLAERRCGRSELSTYGIWPKERVDR